MKSELNMGNRIFLPRLRQSLAVALFLAAVLTAIVPLSAQLPNPRYYFPFRQYYQADYRAAGRDFRNGAGSTFRVGNQRYLDSICFWTMAAECHFKLGNYSEALALYDQSLDLYLAFQANRWQARVQLPTLIAADNTAFARARINWGTPTRNAKIPRIPDNFSTLFGQLDAVRAIEQGGMVENTEFKQVGVNEIMRCVALALHRRRLIKGPTSKYDAFTVKLINGLRGAGAGNGTLLGAYNGVLLGIAEASMDEWERAARTLKSSLQFNGGMDHPLTPVALVELANIGVQTENYSVAGTLALEASYSAAIFNQYDLVEEALALGTQIHLLTNKSPYPPLEPAIAWANRERARFLQGSLLVKLAECLAESGQADVAAKILRQANGVVTGRNDLRLTVLQARLKYAAALVLFMKGDFAAGMTELREALANFQNTSLEFYRLALADKLVVSGGIGQRQADLLYGVLLQDPSELDWRMDPMGAIAFLASDHVGAMERWFDIVVDRKDMDRAINIAELVRRHRFFANLPLGGRLMAFRWVMHAPETALTNIALEQRRSFLTRNPKYQRMLQQAEQIRTQLLLLPIEPEAGSDEARQQNKLFDELAQVSDLQEAMLASFALRREPAELIFPPQFNLSEFRDWIGKDQLALVTLATSSGYHLFFVNAGRVEYIGLGREKDVQRSLGNLLKKLGLMESAMDVGDLPDESWRDAAAEIKNRLFSRQPDAAWEDIRELVIVPDGVLWYMPFELLQIGEGEARKNLCELVDIRYSPTLFLAYDAQRPHRQLKRTGVVLAKMDPRVTDEMSNKAYEELVVQLPEAAKFERQIRVPSNLLASLLDQLVIWSDVRQTRKGSPLELMPMQIDQGKTGTTIEGWMSLPWYGPEHVVMPGFNSDGGSALRSQQKGVDMFLTTCGLMAAGTRTILISRWSTGGANSLALTRNYAVRLPNQSGSQALRESVSAAREMELDYENEPRLRSNKSDPKLKAEHPMFWAGNMLLAIPDDAPMIEEPAEEPVVEPEQKDAEKTADPAEDLKADDPKMDEEKAKSDSVVEDQPGQPAAGKKQPDTEGGVTPEPATADSPATDEPSSAGEDGGGQAAE